ncbi:MAG: gluconeogenesis factor YvcK family protein [Syntrophaceticus sp.]
MNLQGLAVSFKRFCRRQSLKRGPRIAAIGGGTGLPILLRGLKKHTANITAIVTVADDGGSSGRLRGEFGILPPGDIRNCLVALAETETLMEKLFNYRFGMGDGLAGHSLGNLLITALVDITGDFKVAIQEVSHVLKVRGQVLPSTLDQVTLNAELADGTHIFGESRISQADIPLKRVFLTPASCIAVPEAVSAIQQADLILLGPGSLFTSVLPNLLVPGIATAIKQSRAVKCYICNIMTQPGETTNFKASDHLAAIYDHAGVYPDYIIVNNKRIAQANLEKYAKEGAKEVVVDHHMLQKMGVRVVKGDFLDEQDLVRHDPQKLARAVLSIADTR